MLVDDNDLTLHGYASRLGACVDIDVVAAMDHIQALEEDQLWSTIDAVVLDAADEGRNGDQFPGVRVVRHIRTHSRMHQPTIVVVTGHFFDDGLRIRMAEADADFFFLRPEIRSSEKLVDIVLRPEHYRRGVPPVHDRRSLDMLGITPSSTLEGFVDYVEDNRLEAALGGSDHTTSPYGRRALIRHRMGLAKASRIDTVNVSTGLPPPEDQKGPSMRQVRRIWAWAARIKYPGARPPFRRD